jgi:hypothetical protein
MSNVRWPVALFVILAFVFAPGCKQSAVSGGADVASQDHRPAATKSTTAVLEAKPNPVPRGTGKGPASTMLTWSTADGSFGQVYVAIDGGPEKLVVEGAPGTKTIKWIWPKAMYEFRLYQGKEHNTLVAKTQVTRN